MKAVDPYVMTLFHSSVEQRPGTNVLVIKRQLTGGDYKGVNDVLTSIGGKWSRKIKGHVFELETAESLADKLDGLLSTGTVVRLSDMGMFPTPPGLAREIVKLAAIEDGMTVLEPEAGTGNLLRALQQNAIESRTRSQRSYVYFVVAFERDPTLTVRLERELIADKVFCADFLDVEPKPDYDGLETPGGFDRVVMNPPFAKQADVDHVTHAFRFLKPGGRLVAIMSPGFTFRSDKKSIAFRDLVSTHGAWTENPAGSFKQSGTDVCTVTVVLDKPE